MRDWQDPPEQTPKLVEGEVHVWRAKLLLPEQTLKKLSATLSPQEKKQAAAFKFEKDKDCYTASHGILRQLLGQYLSKAPEMLSFGLGEYGRPELAGSLTGSGLNFNLSHSGQLALFAFIWNMDVGVDVEEVRLVPEYQSIMARYFSLEERRLVEQLPEDHKEAAFLTAWSAKEAFLKAKGWGLTGAASLQEHRALPQQLEHLEPGPGYKGAVVVLEENWELHLFQLPWAPIPF